MGNHGVSLETVTPDRLPLADWTRLYRVIGLELGQTMGGSSGVLLAIFFAAVDDASASRMNAVDTLKAGLSRILQVVGAGLVNCPMLAHIGAVKIGGCPLMDDFPSSPNCKVTGIYCSPWTWQQFNAQLRAGSFMNCFCFSWRSYGNQLKDDLMAKGTVKWFNDQKGFGFIQPDDGSKDVFVHISAVERAGLRSLTEGQKISYEIETDKRTGKSSAGNLTAA